MDKEEIVKNKIKDFTGARTSEEFFEMGTSQPLSVCAIFMAAQEQKEKSISGYRDIYLKLKDMKIKPCSSPLCKAEAHHQKEKLEKIFSYLEQMDEMYDYYSLKYDDYSEIADSISEVRERLNKAKTKIFEAFFDSFLSLEHAELPINFNENEFEQFKVKIKEIKSFLEKHISFHLEKMIVSYKESPFFDMEAKEVDIPVFSSLPYPPCSVCSLQVTKEMLFCVPLGNINNPFFLMKQNIENIKASIDDIIYWKEEFCLALDRISKESFWRAKKIFK